MRSNPSSQNSREASPVPDHEKSVGSPLRKRQTATKYSIAKETDTDDEKENVPNSDPDSQESFSSSRQNKGMDKNYTSTISNENEGKDNENVSDSENERDLTASKAPEDEINGEADKDTSIVEETPPKASNKVSPAKDFEDTVPLNVGEVPFLPGNFSALEPSSDWTSDVPSITNIMNRVQGINETAQEIGVRSLKLQSEINTVKKIVSSRAEIDSEHEKLMKAREAELSDLHKCKSDYEVAAANLKRAQEKFDEGEMLRSATKFRKEQMDSTIADARARVSESLKSLKEIVYTIFGTNS